jgi:hypothetical protein
MEKHSSSNTNFQAVNELVKSFIEPVSETKKKKVFSSTTQKFHPYGPELIELGCPISHFADVI